MMQLLAYVWNIIPQKHMDYMVLKIQAQYS
jgi:hypothetical protein